MTELLNYSNILQGLCSPIPMEEDFISLSLSVNLFAGSVKMYCRYWKEFLYDVKCDSNKHDLIVL